MVRPIVKAFVLIAAVQFVGSATVADEAAVVRVATFRCDVTPGADAARDWITIDVEGSGFLHHMARLMAGTLVDIGRGHWPPEHMADILAARNRAVAGHLAPAGGLCLEWIKFRQDDHSKGRSRLKSGR